jgi:AraC-like DNA-binding protein
VALRHAGLPPTLFVFDGTDLGRPFVTHNAEVLSIVARQLEAELLAQLAQRTFRERVKATLKKTLAGQRPELRAVARELGVSPRTLQRRLTDERVTFQHLIAEARRELARHYLQHSSLDLNETAYLLGYEDANSFFRAFHQWKAGPRANGAHRAAPPRKGEPTSGLARTELPHRVKVSRPLARFLPFRLTSRR